MGGSHSVHRSEHAQLYLQHSLMFRGKVGLPDYECDLCSEIGRHRGVFNHNAQVSRTFTVQPKVLAKALGAEDLKALVHKEADGPGVCIRVFRKTTFFELSPAFWIYGVTG